VDEVADRYAIEPELVHSVIQVESNYNPFALSPKGAQGLMQLIPSTAQRFGVRNAFDPSQNLEGGVRYLKHLLALYRGDERLALAAYNAGEGAVERWKGVPPYPETRQYVGEVGKRVRDARQSARKRAGDATAPREFPVIVKRVGPDGREYYSAR
jgi:soluble lytic murein transglycosylase-like protein